MIILILLRLMYICGSVALLDVQHARSSRPSKCCVQGTAFCPRGTIAVGGGFESEMCGGIGDRHGLLLTPSASGVSVLSSLMVQRRVHALCLNTSALLSPMTIEVVQSARVLPNQAAMASCPSDTGNFRYHILGGGYRVTGSGGSACRAKSANITITFNAQQGASSWKAQASGDSSALSARVTSFAVCGRSLRAKTPRISQSLGPHMCKEASVAECRAGTTLLGGGWISVGSSCDGCNSRDRTQQIVEHSAPTEDGKGWSVKAACLRVMAVAMCARDADDPPPSTTTLTPTTTRPAPATTTEAETPTVPVQPPWCSSAGSLNLCDPALLAVGADVKSCSPAQYTAACEGGFFLPNDTMTGVKPACSSYYSPDGFVCQVPCSEGAYCVLSRDDDGDDSSGYAASASAVNSTKCLPYDYTFRVGLGCGGADTDSPCPAGSYCPTSTTKITCPVEHYCHEGSVEPQPCPWLTVCPAGTSAPVNNFSGLFGVALALLALLAVVGWRAMLAPFLQLYRKCSPCKPKVRKRVHKTADHESASLMDVAYDADCVIPSHRSVQREDRPGVVRTALTSAEYGAINVFFDDMSLSYKKSCLEKPEQVIRGVSGCFRGGKVNAIMGGSGAGKTSTMKCLCSRARGGTVGGTITFGKSLTISQLRDFVGYVPQEDIVCTDLTVEENLFYSARYRLPSSVSNLDCRARVLEVMHDLKLIKQRHKVIGEMGSRNISGGQLKRVNIGMEMVANPKILFLDEPTSGLDAASTFVVANVLKTIATNENVNVIMVLHQPRPDVFWEFDTLLVMANSDPSPEELIAHPDWNEWAASGRGGRVAYHGPIASVKAYFQRMQFNCPEGVSFADFMIDVCLGYRKKNGDSAQLSHMEEVADKSLVHDIVEAQSKRTDVASVAPADEPDAQLRRIRAGRIKQSWWCTKRSFLQLWRNLSTNVADAGYLLLGGLLIGLIFRDVSLQKMPMVNFLVSMTIGLAAVNASQRMFGPERVMFDRECQSGHSRVAYFVGKNVASLVPLLVAPLVFLASAYALSSPRGVFSLYYAVLLCAQWACTGLGQLISTAVPPAKAQLAGIVLTLMLNILSGFEPKLPTMNVITTTLTKCSYARWLIEALFHVNAASYSALFDRKIAAMETAYGYDHYAEANKSDAACTNCNNAQHDVDVRLLRCVLVLIAYGLVCRVLAFLFLVIGNRRKK